MAYIFSQTVKGFYLQVTYLYITLSSIEFSCFKMQWDAKVIRPGTGLLKFIFLKQINFLVLPFVIAHFLSIKMLKG